MGSFLTRGMEYLIFLFLRSDKGNVRRLFLRPTKPRKWATTESKRERNVLALGFQVPSTYSSIYNAKKRDFSIFKLKDHANRAETERNNTH